MAARRRKRCPFCRCLYWPDPRTAWRQWACSKADCQRQRRVETQRRWREKNRSDRSARAYREAVSAAKAGESPQVPTRGPLARLPWTEAKDEIGPEVLEMLVLIGRLLVSLLEDEKSRQHPEIIEETACLPRDGPKDVTAVGGPAP